MEEEEDEEEEDKEEKGEPGWLAGWRGNLQSNQELCRIDQGGAVLLDAAIGARRGV